MEIGGGGSGSSNNNNIDSSSSSSPPLHGLKFGKKIYFEDAGGGSGSGSGGGGGGASSSSKAAVAAAGKKGKGAAAAAAPRCQVEGCDVDLSGAKAYYCRHKVCAMHSKAPRVVVAGLEQRFCQQCSRFHQLPEFDQGKRSCRRRLAGHNERRRKPPPGPLSSRYGRLAASFHEEPGRFRSFLLDFSYPRVPSSVRDVWPAVRPGDRMAGSIQWQGSLDPHHHHGAVAGYGAHAYGQGSTAGPMFSPPELPPGGLCPPGVADSSCALSLLSTQPWGTHSATQNRATSSGFGGSGDHPVAPSVIAGNYMAPSPWGSRSHEARNAPHQLHHEVALDEVAGAGHHGQFSGELELALQGSGPPQIDHGSSSSFDHSGNAMHWSL